MLRNGLVDEGYEQIMKVQDLQDIAAVETELESIGIFTFVTMAHPEKFRRFDPGADCCSFCKQEPEQFSAMRLTDFWLHISCS